MPIRVEAYTAGGVATGVVARAGPLREVLDGAGDLLVERSRWLPLDGSGERPAGDVSASGRRPLPRRVRRGRGRSRSTPSGTRSSSTPGRTASTARCRRCRASTRAARSPGRPASSSSSAMPGSRSSTARTPARPAPRAPRQPLHGRPRRGRPDARVLLPGGRDGDHGIAAGEHQAAADASAAARGRDARRRRPPRRPGGAGRRPPRSPPDAL